FAAGAVGLERLTEVHWRKTILRPATIVLLLTGGLILAPLTLPVLPVETYIRYAQRLGLAEIKTEKLRTGALPQHYADMFGWPELTATVADAFHRLPPEEQARCAIFGRNYGEAAAIDFFGPRYGLPKAISKHQNYWLWGPRNYTGECVLTVGEKLADVQQTFNQVEQVATFTHPYVMPYENNLPILLCHQPKASLQTIWPRIKCYSC
ncbi:MAG TPA: hypothetical protein VE821_09790, partial [Pyrinomonadaceae bacterium]|nr:hypothetical protein [Pyrinomonadaceae bacterium]